MAKYAVTLHDAREILVYANDEAGARRQATHAETTRIIIATKRGHPIRPDVSSPESVRKVKD